MLMFKKKERKIFDRLLTTFIEQEQVYKVDHAKLTAEVIDVFKIFNLTDKIRMKHTKHIF